MKQKTTLKLSLVFVILSLLFACETEDMNSTLRTQDLFEFNSVNDPSFSARVWDCETPLRYKLISWGGTIVGTAEAYISDGQLVFEFCVLGDLASGWKIFKTYLFIGSKTEWETLSGGVVPTPTEFAQLIDPDNKTEYDPPVEGCVMVTVDLGDLNLEECFIWAAKVSFVDNSNSENFLNSYAIIDENTYTWDEELQIKENGEICIQECERPGTGTPGYWKNHPDAWPLSEIVFDDCNTYTLEEAIEIMKTKKVDGDKTYDMFNHLVAAMLNVANGTNPECIDDTIEDAIEWMCDYGPVGSGVDASSDAWQMSGEELKDMLDDYNNGLLCNEKRD